jgi:hypothetical protein
VIQGMAVEEAWTRVSLTEVSRGQGAQAASPVLPQ